MITATDMNIYVKLSNIQNELKAPKGQYNSFGKYKYRSCEDILEAVKPICYKYKATLVLSDDVVNIGDRIYVLARATLYDQESDAMVENRAFARESLEKKGMDESQITGTASSYARKYALNGLFNIDDTKDADTDEFHEQTNKAPSLSTLKSKLKMCELDTDDLLQQTLKPYKVKELKDLNDEQKRHLDSALTSRLKKIQEKKSEE